MNVLLYHKFALTFDLEHSKLHEVGFHLIYNIFRAKLLLTTGY